MQYFASHTATTALLLSLRTLKMKNFLGEHAPNPLVLQAYAYILAHIHVIPVLKILLWAWSHIKLDDALELRDGIIFNFYSGLPHILRKMT